MGTILSSIGAIFSLVAGYFIWIAVGMETTTVVAQAPAGFDGVANLQMMHLQAMNLQIGLSAAIIAAIFFVGAGITAAIEQQKPHRP